MLFDVEENGGEIPYICILCCSRLERLWQRELHERGPDDASLRRVVWVFCRTRLIISIVCLMVTQLAGFSGPVSTIHPLSNIQSGLHPMASANVFQVLAEDLRNVLIS